MKYALRILILRALDIIIRRNGGTSLRVQPSAGLIVPSLRTIVLNLDNSFYYFYFGNKSYLKEDFQNFNPHCDRPFSYTA